MVDKAKIRARASDHLSKLRSGSHQNKNMQIAYDAVGFENVGIEILEKTEDLHEAEKRLIDAHDTFKNGFNKNKGGGSVLKSLHRTPQTSIEEMTEKIEEMSKKINQLTALIEKLTTETEK